MDTHLRLRLLGSPRNLDRLIFIGRVAPLVLLFVWLIWRNFAFVVNCAGLSYVYLRFAELIKTMSESVEAAVLLNEEYTRPRCRQRRRVRMSYKVNDHEIVKTIDCHHKYADCLDADNEDDKIECLMIPGFPFSAVPRDIVSALAQAPTLPPASLCWCFIHAMATIELLFHDLVRYKSREELADGRMKVVYPIVLMFLIPCLIRLKRYFLDLEDATSLQTGKGNFFGVQMDIERLVAEAEPC